MRRHFQVLLAAALLSGIPAGAQSSVPEISFDSAADPLKFPANIYLGEAAGVATNSKGDVFVYTRTGHPTITIGTARPFAHGGSRLFQFDRSREIRSRNRTGFLRIPGRSAGASRSAGQHLGCGSDVQHGHEVRSERASAAVARQKGRGGASARGSAVPLDAAREVLALLPAGRGGRGGLPGAGQQSDIFQRPTDVAWDAAGNIYVADGYGNARVAKFDKHGKFIKSWGSKGTETGQFNTVHGIAIDAQGNVYVADSGNKRIQVFDSDGTFKTQFLDVGAPAAICITPGAHQYLYSSNSNPPDNIDVDGEIYKMELNGKIIGKFGKAGKLPKEFGTVNAIGCRGDNELYVGEIGNWRVQKLTLHSN